MHQAQVTGTLFVPRVQAAQGLSRFYTSNTCPVLICKSLPVVIFFAIYAATEMPANALATGNPGLGTSYSELG